jgi:succinyl-diaminopimelate desuccinylase
VARLIDGLHHLELTAIETIGQDEYLGWPSFTPTVIQAPVSGAPQLNVMPRSAQVMVDIRTVPSQSHPEIQKALMNLAADVENAVYEHYRAHDRRLQVKRANDLRVEIEFLTDRSCTFTDRNDPIVQAADWATRHLSGGEPVYAGVPGATDGTFLWALKNIPIVTMGAGKRHVAHQVDEWVDLDQLVETARIYALTALHYLYPGGRRI